MSPTSDVDGGEGLRGIPAPLEALPDSFEARRDALMTVLEGSLLRLLDEAGSRDRMARARAEASGGTAPPSLLLEPPYGRPPDYDPFMDRRGAETLAQVGTTPAAFEDPVPEFTYNYGFNPLRFVSDLIRKSHPESLHALRKRRADEEAELRRRATHAKYQAVALDHLRAASTYLFSGIARSPMISPLSPTSLGVYVWPLRSGTVHVQVSTRQNFSRIDQTVSKPVTTTEGQALVRVDINSLRPSMLYFVRACLEPLDSSASGVESEIIVPSASCESSDAYDSIPVQTPTPSKISGISGNVFVFAQCWTLPASAAAQASGLIAAPPSRPQSAASEAGEGASATPATSGARDLNATSGESVEPVVLLCATGFDALLKHSGAVTSTGAPILRPPLDLPAAFDASRFDTAGGPVFNCVLGDLVDASTSHGAHKLDLNRLLSNGQPFCSDDSILKKSGLFLAWNDSAMGSDASLVREENVYRRYIHEKKKFMKKMEGNRRGSSLARRGGGGDGSAEPLLQRAPVPESLRSLLQALPVEVNETETRNIYRSVQLGDHIELIALDLRRGMLGRYQQEWLQERLQNSNALWKIVLSGAALSLAEVDAVNVPSAEHGGEVHENETLSENIETTHVASDTTGNANQEGDALQPSSDAATDGGATAPEHEQEPGPQQRHRTVSISQEEPTEDNGEAGGNDGKPSDKPSYYFKSSVQNMLVSMQPDLPAPPVADDAQSVKSASMGSYVSSAASTAADKQGEAVAAPEVEIVKSWREIASEAVATSISNSEAAEVPVFRLSSGILFITGENVLAAKSSDNPDRALAGGYVILGNPKDIGQEAFCAEVNIGAAPPAQGKQYVPEAKLGPMCVYSRPADTTSGDEIVATVQTHEMAADANVCGRCALEVRLVQKASGKLIYAARFVVPELDAPSAETPAGGEDDL